MNTEWPRVKIGSVLNRVERFETRDELTEYQFAGTYSFARGIFVGQRKLGSTFALPKVQRIRDGDFVYCKIMAWEGAFGLVSSEADNCVLSGAFVVYRPDLDRVDPKFLDYFFKVPAYWQSIGRQSSGTNVRRQSLHPTQFESACIALPSLSEQRRVVARIEELATKIRTASELRYQAMEEVKSLVVSIHLRLAGNRTKQLAELLALDECETEVIETASYPQVGVRGFGGGLFPKPPIPGTETTYKTFNRLYEGALVLSQVKGWEGAVAVCNHQLAGRFVSPEYRTFRCNPREALPDYLATLVRTEWFWGRLKDATRGVGARRERTRPEQFLALEIPMPDIERQRVGEQIFAQLDTLRHLQSQTSAELDALIPSILDKAFRGEL